MTKKRSQSRQLGRQAAVGGDLAGRVVVVERAQQQEQCAIDNAVSENLVDRAVPAGEGEAVDGQHDQAQVAQGGKGHQPPEVALHQRQARAVENADHRQRNEQRRDGAGLRREQPDVKAQHGVEAQLAGDHHGQGNRRFAECVGQPAMQRKDRHLDRKGEEERERDPAQSARRESCRARCSICSVAKSKLPVCA